MKSGGVFFHISHVGVGPFRLKFDRTMFGRVLLKQHWLSTTGVP